MSRRRRYQEAESAETQIDISPLIDIVFILVIFFIVTTVFNKEVGVKVDRSPQMASSRNLDRNSVMIAVTESGQVFYSGRDIGIDGIEVVINSVQDGGEALPVIIIGDKSAKHELIVRAIDAANNAGAKTVSLATKK